MAGITTRNLAQAKEATGALLDQLGLTAYLFEVEPSEVGDWHVRIDCAAHDGWRSLVIPISAEHLVDSIHNADTQARILNEWQTRLGPTTITSGAGRRAAHPATTASYLPVAKGG